MFLLLQYFFSHPNLSYQAANGREEYPTCLGIPSLLSSLTLPGAETLPLMVCKYGVYQSKPASNN
jgi:hypothetical protein